MFGRYYFITEPDYRFWPRLIACLLGREAPTITTRRPVVVTDLTKAKAD